MINLRQPTGLWEFIQLCSEIKWDENQMQMLSASENTVFQFEFVFVLAHF